jgi:hypothetical protein
MGTAIIPALTKHVTNRSIRNIDVKKCGVNAVFNYWHCWKSIIEKITESN